MARAGRGSGRATTKTSTSTATITGTLVRIHDLDELEKESRGLPQSSMELQTPSSKRRYVAHVRAISLLDTKSAPLYEAETLFNEASLVYCDEITDGNRRRRRVRVGEQSSQDGHAATQSTN